MPDQKPSFNPLKALVPVIKFLIPASVVALKLANPSVRWGWFFAAYVIAVAMERSVETFYSGRFDAGSAALGKDRGFQAVALTYTVMAFIMMFEFFLMPRTFRPFLVIPGIALYLLALLLRLWALRTLGGSWQTISGDRPFIGDRGPYKYIRHPIYLGLIVEILTVPLIPGTFYAFLFSLAVFVPLVIRKTLNEEKDLVKLYGEQYRLFITRRPSYIPFVGRRIV